MNFLRKVMGTTLLPIVFLWPAFAAAEGDSVTVTIYNQNRALINETREMAIPQGTQTVEFKDVAETIDPTSLQVRSLTSPEAFRILDQNYEYDLINVQNLLNKYVGKRLKVMIADPQGAQNAKVIKDARLLANNGQPVFMFEKTDASSSPSAAGEVYVGSYDGLLLPQIPEGLRPQPTLVWLVENRGEPQQKINVSYLAGNMNWKADYVLQLDRSNVKASLSGWVTLDNQSGKAFKQANLKLVAGDIHLVTRPERAPEVLRKMAPAGAAEMMKQEELFEYHLYSLGRPVDIGNKQTKQVGLLQSPELKIEKRLVGRWNSDRYDSAVRGVTQEKLAVLLKFNNSKENGIGLPLPKGIIRAYQESADGSVIFIGEDTIDHTGKGKDVELKAGNSFDVTVERKQTDFHKTGANSVRYGWELKVKNSKDSTQRVDLEETFPGEWRLVNASTKYEKLDARTIRFTVDAPPFGKGEDAVVTYQAELTW